LNDLDRHDAPRDVKGEFIKSNRTVSEQYEVTVIAGIAP